MECHCIEIHFAVASAAGIVHSHHKLAFDQGKLLQNAFSKGKLFVKCLLQEHTNSKPLWALNLQPQDYKAALCRTEQLKKIL